MNTRHLYWSDCRDKFENESMITRIFPCVRLTALMSPTPVYMQLSACLSSASGHPVKSEN